MDTLVNLVQDLSISLSALFHGLHTSFSYGSWSAFPCDIYRENIWLGSGDLKHQIHLVVTIQIGSQLNQHWILYSFRMNLVQRCLSIKKFLLGLLLNLKDKVWFQETKTALRKVFLGDPIRKFSSVPSYSHPLLETLAVHLKQYCKHL